MKTLPKISIVIPSFNKVKYIASTLKSIFDQEYSNLELIVQDGGSTDGTLDIINEYQKKYPKIMKIESKKDDGQLDAITKGLNKATGGIVSFINADDIYEKGVFRKVAEVYIAKTDVLWIAGYGKIIDDKDREIGKFWTACKNVLINLNSYFLLLATSNYLSQPSIFLSREAYKKYGPFTGAGRYVFEYEMWLRLGKISMPEVLPQSLSKFRLGESSESASYNELIFKKDLEVAQKFSGNLFVVALHRLNNFARRMSAKLINK